MELSEQARRNRELWDGLADGYQREHGAQLDVDAPAWGQWSIPEADVGVLPDVAGRDVLELGCGGAQWSIVLARLGARVVALDNSARQLEHARELVTRAGVDVKLIHASAEDVPLADDSFDVVLSDHGALSWGEPHSVVREAARLLRSGGVLAFNVSSPLVRMCWNDDEDRLGTVLHRSYFDIFRIDEGGGAATFALRHGEWVRLLRDSGFAVEALVELRPPEGAATTYGGFVPLEWAREWPAEDLWRARRL
jgi:SAM-dependent methyltransferase